MTVQAAIVGAAELPPSIDGQWSPVAMMALASSMAVADLPISLSDIDGLASASPLYYMPTLTLAERLGIAPRYSDSTTIGGASFVAHLRHASAAIEAGLAQHVLITYASSQRSDGGRYVQSASELSPFEVPYGLRWPITGYAMRARRHMHEFGTTAEQLAEIAVAAREWALANPHARFDAPLTIEDVVTSPMISDPLHRYDCCQVTDWAGAIVVTSVERARDLTDTPVVVAGAAETHNARYISGIPDFASTPAAVTGPSALQQAGRSHDDLDFVQIYDAFTISVLLALEDLGFCTKGDGGEYVEDGKLRPGGALPFNTNGGGLSFRHGGMLGLNLIIEACRQLTGTALGARIEAPTCGLVHAIGGVQTVAATTVLTRDS